MRGAMEEEKENIEYQKIIEKLEIYIKKKKRANKISFILQIKYHLFY